MAKWVNHPNPLIAAQIKAQLGDDSPTPAPARKGRNQNTWSEELTLKTFKALGWPAPISKLSTGRELMFAKAYNGRQWRFDFAWPAHMVALEVDGGIYTGGAHGSVQNHLNDMAKFNTATHLGWAVYHALPEQMPGMAMDPLLVQFLEKHLNL